MGPGCPDGDDAAVFHFDLELSRPPQVGKRAPSDSRRSAQRRRTETSKQFVVFHVGLDLLRIFKSWPSPRSRFPRPRDLLLNRAGGPCWSRSFDLVDWRNWCRRRCSYWYLRSLLGLGRAIECRTGLLGLGSGIRSGRSRSRAMGTTVFSTSSGYQNDREKDRCPASHHIGTLNRLWGFKP